MGWRDSIAEVRVVRCDGYFNVGTGFFVSSKLLITSSHVLIKDSSPKAQAFVYPCDSSEMELPGLEASTVWLNEQLDVAMLLVNKNCAQNIVNLSDNLPCSGMRCVTRGYPEGAKLNGKRAAISLFGITHAPAVGEDFFQCDMETEAGAPEQWAGLSGAPVVIEPATGPAVVIGVVRRARFAMGCANHLEIMASSRIKSDGDYCSAFVNHESSIIQAVKVSRIVSAMWYGYSPKYLKEKFGHQNWYQRDFENLKALNLLDSITADQTELCRAAVHQLTSFSKFDYSY